MNMKTNRTKYMRDYMRVYYLKKRKKILKRKRELYHLHKKHGN